MLKLSHRNSIFLSGAIWLGIGIYLLSLGIHFVLKQIHLPFCDDSHFSILSFFCTMIENPEKATVVLISLCLFIGYLKGRYVLGKSVKRQVERILSFPGTIPLKSLYSARYYVLLFFMIGLGVSMRYLPISLDTRGAIDIIIGAALINGALLYFRSALTSLGTPNSHKESNKKL